MKGPPERPAADGSPLPVLCLATPAVATTGHILPGLPRAIQSRSLGSHGSAQMVRTADFRRLGVQRERGQDLSRPKALGPLLPQP